MRMRFFALKALDKEKVCAQKLQTSKQLLEDLDFVSLCV